ncbi:hypothetical protein F5880DRAFT_1612897 [Lentinula raphanica]|nr:hypothetical protein F5880DRAFT_1612897 [Lentinula raphanica]
MTKKHPFILLEAEEDEDSDYQSSDSDEADIRAISKIPAEYALPSASSSYRLDDIVEHLSEAYRLHEVTNARSSDVFPTAVPISTARDELATRKPVRRPASALPLDATMSSNTEAAMAEGVIVDEGEEDPGTEDEVELTNDQRLLKQWISRYLGAGGLAAPGFRFFYVRCQVRSNSFLAMPELRKSIQPRHEKAIVDRISTDIQHRRIDPQILRAALPSALPGGVYLHAQSMLPRDTVLASYLLTIPGLLYSKTPRFAFSAHESTHIPPAAARADLMLPIHSPIDNPVNIKHALQEPSYLNQYPPHTWVRCKRGLYKDDVGLVVTDDFNEIDYDVERLVLFPPRVDWNSVPDLSSGRSTLKRKRSRQKRPDVLSWDAAQFITQTYCLATRMDCASHCETPQSCSHSEATHKRYVCLGNQWQNGLVLKRIKLKDMELATAIPADIRYYFIASKHSAVQQSLLWMPSPLSWEFQVGEDVRFTDFNGVWCTPDGHYTFELPEGRTEGTIQYVGPSYCEVNIQLQDSDVTVTALHTMSKVHLEKIFHPGDIVSLPSGARHLRAEIKASAEMEEIDLTGKEGLVVNAGPSKVGVLSQKSRTEEILEFHPNTLIKVKQSVAIQDVLHYCPQDCMTAPESSTRRHTHSSMNPSTAPIPWKDLEVYPVKYSNKGYRAIVVDAKQDSKTVSGLSVRIRYETQGMSNSFAWVDYDSLRRVDNDRFLHDDDEVDSYTIWDSYWRLKPGYSPEYSAEERYSRKRQKSREEDELAGTEPPRATTPFSYSPSTSANPSLDSAWDPSSPVPLSSDPSFSGSSSPGPSLQHWILDPRIMNGLQDSLQLLVATNTDPKRDRLVFIRRVNAADTVKLL